MAYVNHANENQSIFIEKSRPRRDQITLVELEKCIN